MTEADLKQFIALEGSCPHDADVIGSASTARRGSCCRKESSSRPRKNISGDLDGRISRQLTQMRKNTEHRERTLNALLLEVAEIRCRLGIDPALPMDEPHYRN